MTKEIAKLLIENSELTKSALSGSQKMMGTLFGGYFGELNQMYADKIRLRRFKNQVEIFAAAKTICEENNLNPKQINLKLLVPLIKECSLEEDKNIQQMWANLIANISTKDETGFERKAIDILSSLSSKEAKILDSCYELFLKKREAIFKNSLFYRQGKRQDMSGMSVNDVPNTEIVFLSDEVRKHNKIPRNLWKIYLDNLSNYGFIIWGEPEVKLESFDSEYEVEIEDGDEKDSKKSVVRIDYDDIDANVIKSKYFHLSSFGLYFIELCKMEKKKK